MTLKVGGQAFANGVLMRSKKHWALATEDGQVHFGSVSSWLDHHPRLDMFFIRSVVAFVETVYFGLMTQRRHAPWSSRRLWQWLLVYAAITLPVAFWLKLPTDNNLPGHVLFQLFALAAGLFALTRMLPRRLWTYHGAEHKAVNAYEQGVDLEDTQAVQGCSRIHNRCGTNLVAIIVAASIAYVPATSATVALLATAAYTLVAIGLSIELFRLVVRFPERLLSRVVLFPGKQMQKFVTTREPADDQIDVATKALRLVLVMEDIGPARPERQAAAN